MVALSFAAPDAQPVDWLAGCGVSIVWVLHDGKAGMASQALGVAEAAGFPFVEKPLSGAAAMDLGSAVAVGRAAAVA